MTRFAAALAPLALCLAACGGHSDSDAQAEEARAEALRMAAAAKTDDTGIMPFGPDLATLKLGPKVADSQFDETFTGPTGEVGKLSGYVACPDSLASCDEADDGTVYTYVLEVTPTVRSSVFRLLKPAYGFTGVAGYDEARGRGAIPGDSQLVMRCLNGALAWVVRGGEGWSGLPVTVYWQSTSPPSGEAAAYELLSKDDHGTATAPFPADGSTDKCG